MVIRCDWANKNETEKKYHDTIWGKPQHDDQQLFKMLILEGKQAGLSWLTILSKMDGLCAAFDQFDPEKMALYDDKKVLQLLNDERIIRNKLKIQAAVHNAKMYIQLREKYKSLDHYLWNFVDGKPIINCFKNIKAVPSKTDLSDKISKELKKEGFKFVGSTTVYAFMQAVGIVNDHLIDCYFR